MALTNVKVKHLAAKERDFKQYDEKGLYVLVRKDGAKYWRFRYRFGGKEKVMAFGVYPEVSLKEARERRDAARRLLRDDLDPMEERKKRRFALEATHSHSFEAVAWEWFEKEKDNWALSHVKKQQSLLANNLIPYLGKTAISDISSPALLECLRIIEARGALETTRRTKQIAGQIFRYGIATGRTERDPSHGLKGALKTPKQRHFPAITDPERFGELLRAIDGYSGSIIVATALKLAPLVFVRPGELRSMEWKDIDLDLAEWRIPANKIKMKQDHIVPLARQAVELISSLRPITGHFNYVFTGERSRRRCMSDNAINAALRRLGYRTEDHTAHGFRASARTILDEELNFDLKFIEHQLAHEVRDPLGRAYNRTQHLAQRREMMQTWANYLDGLKQKTRLYKKA